jgi:hypothetical protein
MNWRQGNPKIKDYHSDPMEMPITFGIPNNADWSCWHEETHTKYTSPSNTACDIVFNIAPGVGMYGSFSLGQDVIRWGHSETTSKRLPETVVARQVAQANTRLLAGDYNIQATVKPANDLEFQHEVDDRMFHQMAMVHSVF